MVQCSVLTFRRRIAMTDVINTNDSPNYLSPEDIIKCDDIVYADVEVPEWSKNGKPGIITLRSFNAAEASEFSDKEDKDKGSGPVSLVARMAWNRAENKPLFTAAQVNMLKLKSNKVFLRLQRECMKLNGWRTPEERQAALEAAKNDSSVAK
jgi:hypothetical protein